MNLTKSSRYALYAALEMAMAGDEPVTAAGVAAKHHISPTVLAKILQQLVRAGIAIGARGMGGGYRLARQGSSISVLDVVSVFESPRSHTGHVSREDRDKSDLGLLRLFDEVDEQVRCTFASVSLDTLAGKGR
ncbi:MAG: Rrf2 family transcriptional regulator [Acidobacteriota bacterium]